jgi:hypothetical protein
MMLNKITRMMRSRKGQMTIAGILIAVVGLAVALYFLLRKRRDGFANIAYRTRIPDATAPNGWRCPKGWTDTSEGNDTGEGGGQGPGSAKQCAYMRYKTVGEDGKCPVGYVKVDRPPKGSDAKYVCRHAHRGEKEAKDIKQSTLKKEGDACTRDNQCENGVCWENKCKPKFFYGDGATCRNNRFCKSKICRDGYCRPASGSPAPAPAPASPDNTKITLWQDAGFRGAKCELGVGEYPNLKSAPCGDFNDTTSSINIPAGYKVQAWSNADYRGFDRSFSGDVSSVYDKMVALHDAISSVKISKA